MLRDVGKYDAKTLETGLEVPISKNRGDFSSGGRCCVQL
jgi:hypothetical protein